MKTETITFAIPEGLVEDVTASLGGWSITIDAGHPATFSDGLGASASNEESLHMQNKLYDYSDFDWSHNDWLLVKEGVDDGLDQFPSKEGSRWKETYVIVTDVERDETNDISATKLSAAARNVVNKATMQLA